jgi:hypothetical protein
MCRETSRVSFLMCPFCVRPLLTHSATAMSGLIELDMMALIQSRQIISGVVLREA